MRLLSVLFFLICSVSFGQQIINLPADTAPTGDDLLYVVNDPGGTPGGRKATLTNVTKGLAAATASLQGVVTTGTQTFGGTKIFPVVGVNVLTPLTELHVASTSSSSPRGILSSQFSTDTNGARVGFAKARGTEGSPTTVVTADTLGRMMFRGYDGTNFLEMASIEATATGTIAATRVPTSLVFSTATNAVPSVLTTRLTIDNAGTSTFTGQVSAIAGSAAIVPMKIKAATAMATNLLEVDSSSGSGGDLFKIGLSGGCTSAGSYVAANASLFYWSSRSAMGSPSDGVITLSNNAVSDFSRLQLGGTTSSFPAIKRNATAINFRLADDSADAPITAGATTIGGGTTITKVMSAAATLDFASTAAGAVADLTITVTGAVAGDVVSLTVPNGSVTATGSFSGWVSAADTVTVRFIHNHLVNAEDPASGSFRAMVTRF